MKQENTMKRKKSNTINPIEFLESIYSPKYLKHRGLILKLHLNLSYYYYYYYLFLIFINLKYKLECPKYNK